MTLKATLGGLRIKLVLLTLLALLPLGLIALLQSYQEVEENRALNERMLIDSTRVAAADQREQIKQAVGAGYGLGTIARTVDLQTCRNAMQRFLKFDSAFAFAGFVPVNGIMECSSAGDTVLDFSDYDTLQEAIDRADIYVEVNANGAVSGMAVVIVSVPVFEDETLIGFVSLSLPQESVTIEDSEGIVLAAIGTSGEVFGLSADATDPDAFMPADLTPLEVAAQAGSSFVAEDASGQPRLFSVTQPVANSYVIVGSWAQSDLVGIGVWRQALMPVLFAVLMWAASMAVAYIGLDRLVLRHLKELRSAMRQFALGERNSEGLRLDNAPAEFKDAERAFNRMALLITEAEAKHMTDLHDKEVLLREVHHRVKNNLQMIASIMNLQARAAKSDEVADVLAGLQRRVRGLAMLHRSLYSEAETSRVNARDLIAAVVSDGSAVITDPKLKIETDLVSVMLYPDQAVPLSMWMAEALTNAVKYVGRDGQEAVYIRVTMSHDEAGRVTVRIENSIGTRLVHAPEAESTGLGTKLMSAFCRQLEGTVETDDADGTFVHVLRFQVQDFDAEPDQPHQHAGSGDVAAA